jgi:hypothetical protein
LESNLNSDNNNTNTALLATLNEYDSIAIGDVKNTIELVETSEPFNLSSADEMDSFLSRIEEIPQDEIAWEIDNFWIDINGGFIAWKAVICLNLLDYKKLGEVYHNLVDSLGTFGWSSSYLYLFVCFCY